MYAKEAFGIVRRHHSPLALRKAAFPRYTVTCTDSNDGRKMGSEQLGLARYLEKRGISNGLEKAEQFYALLEGGFILSKAHRDVKYLQQQKKLVRLVLES